MSIACLAALASEDKSSPVRGISNACMAMTNNLCIRLVLVL